MTFYSLNLIHTFNKKYTSNCVNISGKCNQYFKGKYYCPGKKWFMSEPCEFISKSECDNFRRMCGEI